MWYLWQWALQNKKFLCLRCKRHKAIYQGLGGSFDVYSGHQKRAPKWWIDHNMEFAYRLIKQPKRITRNFHFIKYAYWLVTKKL